MSAKDKLKVMKQSLLLITVELRKFGLSGEDQTICALYEVITDIEALQSKKV